MVIVFVIVIIVIVLVYLVVVGDQSPYRDVAHRVCGDISCTGLEPFTYVPCSGVGGGEGWRGLG